MTQTAITLIRHGETTWNADGRWQGWSPSPLSKKGKQQAEAAAHDLKHAGIDRLITSDLYRTVQTAKIINQQLKIQHMVRDRRLREVDVGTWQGMTADELERYDADNWQKFQRLPRTELGFPDGESFAELAARCLAAIDDLATQYAGSHILLVVHGGVVRSVATPLYPNVSRKSIENCSITRIIGAPQCWKLVGFAENPKEIVWN